MSKKIRNDANKLYDHYIQEHQPILLHEGFLITAGIAEVIENENCIVIFDLIYKYQDVIESPKQHWYIEREIDKRFNVYCKDFKGEILIPPDSFTMEFYFDDFYFIVDNRSVYLPVEYDMYLKRLSIDR